MIKILFICHGNICRSPMAEFMLKDTVEKLGVADKFHIESAATSYEETGNPVHRGTRARLAREGIRVDGKTARRMEPSDYENFDFLIGMDDANIRNMNRMYQNDPKGKIFKMLSFAGIDRDVADPWYTGNFEQTYDDIEMGIRGLLEYIKSYNG